MPDEDNNFSGSIVLDFRKWWRRSSAAQELGTLSTDDEWNDDE